MRKFLVFCLLTVSLFAKQDDENFLYHDYVSEFYYNFLDNSTSWIYKNKSNYDYIKKHNKLRIYINNQLDEDGKLNSSLSIRANIKLPKISDKLYITVDKDDNTNTQNKEDALANEKQSSRVGLKYYLIRHNDKNIYLKLGGRPTFDGAKIYLKFGLDKVYNYNNFYTSLYFNEYYYFKNNIFKSNTGFNFRKKLNNTWAIGQYNDFTINHNQNNLINISNTLLLDQYLDSKEMLTYWITLYTNHQNNNFEQNSLTYNIKYHKMLKKWIFIDIIPSVVRDLKLKKYNRYLYVNFGFIF